MAMDKVMEKYVNIALAESFERMMKYKKLCEKPSISARDKAAWKALYLDNSSMFNFLMRTIGPLGTTKLAKDGIEAIEWNKENLRRQRFIDSLDEEDVEIVIYESYKLSKLQRDTHKDAERTVIVDYMIKHPQIVQRVTEQLESLKQAMARKHRGNPTKGGLVRAAMAKGYMPLAANAIAEEQLLERDIDKRSEEWSKNRDLPAIIAQVEKDMGIETKKTTEQDLMAMLTPGSSVVPQEIIDKANISEVESDFSEFDDPELLEKGD